MGIKITTNSEADGAVLDAVATPEGQAQALLAKASAQLKLSARGYHRVLRVARTLADMENSGPISRVHVAEALSYRRISPGRS